MRIVDLHEISVVIYPEPFSLIRGERLPQKEYLVEDDQGQRFRVSLPDHPLVEEKFRLLSDANGLRSLINLEPEITSNIDEYQDHFRTSGNMLGRSQPKLWVKITWMTTDANMPLMDKLALGGSR